MKKNSFKLETLITKETLQNRVASLAQQISADFRGEHLHLIGILKGAWIFMADLIRHLQLNTSVDFITVSSYASSMKSTGKVTIVKDLNTSIKGLNVLLIEDICETGLTLDYLTQKLKNQNPKSLSIVSLLSKFDKRKKKINLNYVGFEIENHFVVGYGLDYQENFRNLPTIHAVQFNEKKILN